MVAVRKFNREHRCTKVHLWNCFRGPSGFRMVPVVESRVEIGDNAPKYLLREGFAVLRGDQNVDYYALTPSGERWLVAGLKRHLELHPEDKAALRHPIPGTVSRSTGRSGSVRVLRRG